jgi:hypothetical protein
VGRWHWVLVAGLLIEIEVEVEVEVEGWRRVRGRLL